MAGPVLKSKAQSLLWIAARYPFVTAWTLVGVLVVGILLLDGGPGQNGRSAPPPDISSGLTGPLSAHGPVTHPPQSRVRRAGQALGLIERACRPPSQGVRPTTLGRPLHQIVSFAKRYPNGHFTLGGESGTTIALLLVTRFVLTGCDATEAHRVNDLVTQLTR